MIIQTSILSQIQPRAFTEIKRTYDVKPAPTKETPAAANEDGDTWESPQPRTFNALSDAEQKQVLSMQERDREVKNHEMAHVRAGGDLVQGPFYTFEEGPDGRAYAVDGEVMIDTSEVPNDPRQTITKMQRVQLAALAPVNPSPQDRKVAAEAARKEAVARAELRKSETDTMRGIQNGYGLTEVYDASAQTSYESAYDLQSVESSGGTIERFALLQAVSQNKFTRSPGPGLYLQS